MLVVVTPTGSGWIDPAAMDAVEYLHRGDVASVAVSSTPICQSPLSLLVEPEYGSEAAKALFAGGLWILDDASARSRPKLYLHGLSLGAMNSEKSAELFEMIG